MIKKHLKLLCITSAVILLPILAGLFLWNQLPDQLPFHWNAAGEADGWAGKPVVVFGTSLLMLALHWLCIFATTADPKKQNHSDKILHLIFWIIPLLSVLMHTLTYAAALGKDVRMELVMPLLVGLIFVITGNYLPKCKQSYTIGIKLPWTLHSEENWNKTHRFTGFLWVVCGLLIALTSFIGGVWLLLPIVFVMVFFPTIYSYLLHRKGV